MSRPLEIEGLTVAYDDHEVLRDLDLAVEAGSFVVVLGSSGCGKTSLLRALAGFAPIRRGRVTIGGRLVADGPREIVPPEARGLGMVFQDYALFPHLSVGRNLAFGLSGRDTSARVREMLELVRLESLEERRPAELSGGQQQRVALARALAPRPALLLLDEPFANLDARLRGRVAEERRDGLARTGTAGLMVTHDREEALALADRVLVLGSADEGRASCLQEGRPEEVYRRPRALEVAALTGKFSRVRGEGRGATADTAFGAWPLAEAREGAVDVVVRPEELALEATDASSRKVAATRFRGRVWMIELRAGDESLVLEHECDLPPGTPVTLRARRPVWALPAT
ncbi:MAG: ABC transporter ATP-binding protein [Planctomycetota bacterium]